MSRKVENQDEHKRADEGMRVCAGNEGSHFTDYKGGYWALFLFPKFANGYQKRILIEKTTISYLEHRRIKNYSKFMEQEQPANIWSKVCRETKLKNLITDYGRLKLNKMEYQNLNWLVKLFVICSRKCLY